MKAAIAYEVLFFLYFHFFFEVYIFADILILKKNQNSLTIMITLHGKGTVFPVNCLNKNI